MADATDSKSVVRKGVWVRVPPRAPAAGSGSRTDRQLTRRRIGLWVGGDVLSARVSDAPATGEERIAAGRGVDVAEILSQIERTCAGGHGTTVLIEGEAGIGKTTLLDNVAAGATDLGVTVVRTCASVADLSLPFGPLLDAFGIDPSSGTVGAALSDDGGDRRSMGRVSPLQMVPAERSHVIERIAGVIETWSVANPLLLMLDDMHWADPATLATVSRLRRLSATQRFTVVVAFRPVPHDHELRTVIATTVKEDGEHRMLSSLDADAVRELLIEAIGHRPSPALLAVALRAGGNPFLTKELVSYLTRDGQITVADGQANIDW